MDKVSSPNAQENAGMTLRHRIALLVVCFLAGPSSSRGEDRSSIAYNRDVRPILANHCFKCHGPDLKKGGLNLKERETALKTLRSGSVAIVPGKSTESALIERVTSTEETERMPPKGKPLTTEQIATLKTWIDQGAKYEEHWAYVKPVRPPLAAVQNQAWPRTGIDYFILKRLEQEGLTPAPEADRATLLRRASLDLTGLPPTLEELDRFLSDPSGDAYEKAVDRLLASPHYGEHQARYWLDQARYADTNGYEADHRRSIWPWRDWVINAFNRDLPFDQFTIEQIAGDLLPNATREQIIATGFHRNTMVNTEGGTDDEEFRVAALVDRVNTTMGVWMGTTFNCAQCHNHKYDPFTMKDYYGMFAFFNGTADQGRSNTPELALYTPEQEAQKKRLQEKMAPLQKGSAAGGLAFGIGLKARIVRLQKEEAAITAPTTLVMRELPKTRPTHVMIRGNFKNLGEAVTPAVPAKLHPLRKGEPLKRLGLAHWLVDPDNPLVGRVTMNRIWSHFFGRSLVETSEDFGIQGELPTHPELLDWLATELLRERWSLKAVHKLIVTSATYRQSTRVSPELYRRDPFNRLYARGPRFRLDAEMVRDNALAISGLLNRKVGGPSVFPYQPDGIWFNPYSGDKWVTSKDGDQHRRGLYTFWRRTAPYAEFVAFDAPSREVCTERRPRTNTPLQALATLNDKVFVEASAALARRMLSEAKGSERERATYGFRLCVARTPTPAELDQLTQLYRENLEKYRKEPGAAQALARSGGTTVPPGMDVAELAAWTVVANVLLNLDETITKG
jgi:mono/diheme cytochrome c family protein